MRIVVIATALLAVSACSGGAKTNNSAANVAPADNKAAAAAPATAANNSAAANSAAPKARQETAAAMPANFPGEDLLTRGSECIVYLGHSQNAKDAKVGFDATAMSQAQDQWESALKADPAGEGWQQMVGSSVNVLASVPAAQRDAASAWCVKNAPEVDPEG